MSVEDEDRVNDCNALEDGVVEGSTVGVISLFVDLADAAVAYRAFPFTLIEVFTNPIDNTSNVTSIAMIVFLLVIIILTSNY
jgi:hypothetical protein